MQPGEAKSADERERREAALQAVAEALEDAHVLLHETADAYHDPDGFRRRLDLFVQATRNVTFRAQAYKSDFAGFDVWYEGWQAAMKADPTMKWIHDARTRVTKQRGLVANSRARARVITSYLRPGTIAEREVDPRMPNEVIAAAIAAHIPLDARSRALIEVNREWQFDELPGREALQAGRHAITFLNAFTEDLVRLASEETTVSPDVALAREPLPDCMADFDTVMTIRINAETGLTYHPAQRAVEFDPAMQQKVAARYGFHGIRPFDGDPADLDAVGERYMEIAKQVLQRDKFHAMFVFLRRPDGRWEMRGLLPEDRLDKYILWHRLADEVRSMRFDAFVLVAETWIAPEPEDGREPPEQFEGMKGRKEALMVHVESSAGFRKRWTTLFRRRRKKIIFSPTVVQPAEPFGGFSEPIREAWRDLGAQDTESPKTDD